jgi:hypothetical protein
VTTELRHWFDKAGPLEQSIAALAALFALTLAALLLWRASRLLRGKKAADTLTVVAAAMASSVAATGMWHFFSRTMHLPVWIQAVLFAFMEISVLASALRARANVARDGNAGADGLAVWVLTCASGLMSASEAGSPQEALVRLGAPLVAAWLWERSMVPERRAQRAAKGAATEAAVRWLFSYKRIAVRLGLATALGADLETEDANRRIDRFVRADNRAQRAGFLTRRHAGRRRDRAHARLMEQARMQADPRALYAHLGRQAILDVLARLGGDDAVIDRERARQMQHILADATSEQTGPAATASPAATGHGISGDDAAPASTSSQRQTQTQTDQRRPQTQAQPQFRAAPAMAEADQGTDESGETVAVNGNLFTSPLLAEATAQFTGLQDELPLPLPDLPSAHAASAPTVNALNGFHIPAARQPVPAPEPAAPQATAPAEGPTAGPAHVNGNTVAPRAQPPTAAPSQPARAPIPVEPVRFVAAQLPEPEPEPEPIYAYDDPEPEYEPEPRPAPIPAPANTGVIDQQLANRIIRAIAASDKPNLLKLANELGISIAHMQDTIDALGGFNAVWTRTRQDRDAETSDNDVTYYTA